ncbi:hypothetical protein [Sphingomonas sp. SORGH_AS_0438]|uniref:hypothetical protein n=1 Tax=Sphingomonas sp. SORGH_AS_0438 TaxID=3041756 RepID=UPI0028604311|nr:hypothetical protein [Sphingomonas sp. SORGH_AS_0438]MDR6127098.1 hypothetical protein [Sphingomonas sp. SORGH_AS_0438]
MIPPDRAVILLPKILRCPSFLIGPRHNRVRLLASMLRPIEWWLRYTVTPSAARTIGPLMRCELDTPRLYPLD